MRIECKISKVAKIKVREYDKLAQKYNHLIVRLVSCALLICALI